MTNNYNVAAKVLKAAAGAIHDRSSRHGDTEKSFHMIGQLWHTYLSHTYALRKNTQITPYDVAKMLGMVKIARATYGYSEDNPADEAGYAALSAMLNPRAIEDELAREVHKSVEEDKTNDGTPTV